MAIIPTAPITVLGAGSFGTALALLLARNGNQVRLWGNESDRMQQLKSKHENEYYLPGFALPDNMAVFTDLAKSLEGVQDILIVVPSHAFTSILKKIKPLVPDNVRIAWGSKGLDPQTQDLLHVRVADIFSKDTPMVVVAGPSFAKEVAANLPTAVSIASNNPEFCQDCVERFHNDRFRVYVNSDMIGVELCGALKNILAIAVGIADGLSLGANTRAALITRGLAEMSRLCEALGGHRTTLMGLAGVGDLVLTCTDNQSRNRRFGLAVGQGKTQAQALEEIGQAVEGLQNVKQVHLLSKKLHVDMPIVEQVYQVLEKGVSPSHVLSELLERAPKREI